MGPLTAAAVAGAYRVFGGRTVGPTLNVCRCSVCFGDDTATEARLVQTPLHDLDVRDLAEYANSAHGWDDEMLYFLPRVLDLIAQGEVPRWIGLEFCLSRLAEVDWRIAWPAAQRAAVEEFFAALFTEALHRPDLLTEHDPGRQGNPIYGASGTRDLFCLVANAGGVVAPLLDVFDAQRGRVPDLHLAALVNDTGEALWDGRLGWHTLNNKDAEAAIAAWLSRPETGLRLEEAFLHADGLVETATLSAAQEVLGNRGPDRS